MDLPFKRPTFTSSPTLHIVGVEQDALLEVPDLHLGLFAAHSQQGRIRADVAGQKNT